VQTTDAGIRIARFFGKLTVASIILAALTLATASGHASQSAVDVTPCVFVHDNASRFLSRDFCRPSVAPDLERACHNRIDGAVPALSAEKNSEADMKYLKSFHSAGPMANLDPRMLAGL
jgi:hypothetical protein